MRSDLEKITRDLDLWDVYRVALLREAQDKDATRELLQWILDAHPDSREAVSAQAKLHNLSQTTEPPAVTADPAIQTSLTASPPTEPVETRCPYCSELILSTARKCKHCGEWLESGVAATPLAGARAAERGAAGSGFLKVLGWIWIVLSSLGAIAIWMAASAERAAMGRYVQPAEASWLTQIGSAVALAALIQGITIGTIIIVIANHTARPRT